MNFDESVFLSGKCDYSIKKIKMKVNKTLVTPITSLSYCTHIQLIVSFDFFIKVSNILVKNLPFFTLPFTFFLPFLLFL